MSSYFSLVLLEHFGPEHSESLAHTCRAGSTLCLCRDFLCPHIVDNSWWRGAGNLELVVSEYEQRKRQASMNLVLRIWLVRCPSCASVEDTPLAFPLCQDLSTTQRDNEWLFFFCVCGTLYCIHYYAHMNTIRSGMNILDRSQAKRIMVCRHRKVGTWWLGWIFRFPN
jgi:hypothetical protein